MFMHVEDFATQVCACVYVFMHVEAALTLFLFLSLSLCLSQVLEILRATRRAPSAELQGDAGVRMTSSLSCSHTHTHAFSFSLSLSDSLSRRCYRFCELDMHARTHAQHMLVRVCADGTQILRASEKGQALTLFLFSMCS